MLKTFEVGDGYLTLNLTPLETPIAGKDAGGAGVISSQRQRYGYYESRVRLGDGINDDNDSKTDEGWHHAFWAMHANADEKRTRGYHVPRRTAYRD